MDNIIGLVAGTSGDSLSNHFKRLGYKIALVSGRENEPGSDIADFVFVTDLDNSQDIVDFFISKHVKFVILGTGHYKAIELLPLLEKANLQTNLNLEKFNLVKDKLAFKDHIAKKGFLTPEYFSIHDKEQFLSLIGQFKFPCVVKSAIDVVQPAKVNDYQRLEQLVFEILEKSSSVLIEEYIDGSDCTVAVTNVGLDITNYGVIYYSKAKEYTLEGFINARADKLDIDLENKICHVSNELIRYLNIPGLVRVDYIVKDNISYILEVNAVIVTGYTGSAYPFFSEIGVDISEVIDNTALKICLDKST
jgi:phosphoribosylaminoimidazole carboxylase (NCAIR synthetase)